MIGRRSFLAGIGATLAVPYTARAPVPASPMFVLFTSGNGEAVAAVRTSLPAAPWRVLNQGKPFDVDEWREVCREASLRLEAIDAEEAEARPQAETSAAT